MDQGLGCPSGILGRCNFSKYWGRARRNGGGETVEVDLDYGKINVVVDSRKELCFDTTVDFVGGEFHGGDETFISLKYEKLLGIAGRAFACLMIWSSVHSSQRVHQRRRRLGSCL